MPEFRVDVFESIDIEDDQRQIGSAAYRFADFARKDLFHVTPIEYASERIDERSLSRFGRLHQFAQQLPSCAVQSPLLFEDVNVEKDDERDESKEELRHISGIGVHVGPHQIGHNERSQADRNYDDYQSADRPELPITRGKSFQIAV